MNGILRRNLRLPTYYIYRCVSSSVSVLAASNFERDLLDDINKKINENKKILRKKDYSNITSRGVDLSNRNLRYVRQIAENKIMEAPANSIANIPAYVTIEVLGNGSGHLRSCVVIRTPLKTYLFNCPEGASRFLPQLRLKSLNVNDIFITRPTWDNIAGISSILLSKEANALPTRLHGAMNIKHFLECIRPFQDADYGTEKYPSQVDERPFDMESYEDAGMKITYIPLSPPLGEGTSKNLVDVAYLVELKKPARRIDIKKLISLKIPKGPLIGKLKNGETIQIADGRTISPDEVLADDVPREELPRVLIVECSTEAHVQALADNSLFSSMSNGELKVDYMVHLSKPAIISLPMYESLVGSMGESCRHIVVNEDCPTVPAVESIYRNHRLLRHICPRIFPELHPQNWSGLITQESELEIRKGPYTYAAPLQRFWMRKGGNEESIIADLRETDLGLSTEAVRLVKELGEVPTDNSCEFPRVSFLGTSSAVPSKYRNVTGYLMETSADTAIMVDVGEGSYGQLIGLFGHAGTAEMMLKLRAIFITHAHQDHMNGLYTIIQRRQEAFRDAGKKYVPLLLATNRNVLKPLSTYSMCFEDLQKLVSIVDISRHPITPPVSPGAPPNKRQRLPSPIMPPSRNILDMFPRPLFNESAWNIQEIKAVQVHHTRMANGFVFSANNKRIVFSGDTKPCELLVSEGMNADLLIHEATFEDGHERDAERKKHSTMGQAVSIGKKMNAKHVMLTHFSARYPKVPELPKYLEECGNVGVAMDNLSVRFDHLPLVPHLIPIYREVYQEELFEIEMKKQQRQLRSQELKAEHENSLKAKGDQAVLRSVIKQ